jgi:trimeric autotransporter adhesin
MRFDLRSKSRREAALRSRQRTRRPETGDTLIEVLLAVMVMGISSAAILLAFGTSIFGSSEYRGLATTDTVLRTVAEEVTNDLQIQSTTMWLNCSGVFAFDTTANPTGQTVVQVPSSYKVSSITATYWSSSQGTYVAQTASELPPNTVSCPTAGQPPVLLSNPSALVTITIASGANSYSISTVVNDPAAPATPVFGTATKLVFIGQPGNGTVGNALSTPPEVAVEDVNSQIVTTDLSSVQLALTSPSDASGAALSGDCSGAEIGGVITFSNCSVNKADVSGDGGFTLTATDTGLASATSSAFYVSAGTPAQIVFSQQPGNGLGGAGLSPEPQVTVEDAYGDVVTNDASSLSLSILSGTGATGAQVTSGCSSPTESAGVFSFTNCGVNLDNPTNNPYQFVATDGTMTADSSSFTVSTGPAAGLVFTTSPGASTLGSTFSANPVVAIADAGGNPLGSAASATTINLALQSGSGTLSCTNTSVTSSGGSATFSGCKILTGGTQGTYQLKATGTYTAVTPHVVLTPGVSSQFTVAGGAFALLFTTTPGPSSTGATFAIQPVVEVVDSSGDLVTTSNASISLKNAAVAPNNAGTVGCPLSVPVPSVTAVNGIATFSNCELTVSGSSEGTYTLDAYETSTPTITGNSGPFKVAGTPTQLAFTTSPGPSTTGTTFAAQPVVAVEDTAGDLVTSSTAIVTLSVNSGSGTVGCPTSTGDTVTAVGGIASFSQCQVALSGTGGGGVFKLGAAVPLTTLTGVSSSFSVAGPATKLAFTTQPSNGTGGVNLATQPQVTVEDANGYPVTADSSTVVLSLNPPLGVSGAAMSDTCSGTETEGVVAFAGCSVKEAATS